MLVSATLVSSATAWHYSLEPLSLSGCVRTNVVDNEHAVRLPSQKGLYKPRTSTHSSISGRSPLC